MFARFLQLVHIAIYVRHYARVKEYLSWFDMLGGHIAGIVVAVDASTIRADSAAADHRYTRRAGRYFALRPPPRQRVMVSAGERFGAIVGGRSAADERNDAAGPYQ